MKTIENIALIIAATLAMSFTGCIKKSGCDMVIGDLNATGELHYSETEIEIPKWPHSETMLDVNAFFVLDNSEGRFYDTVVITKSSVPSEYRGNTKTHVRVSLKNTAPEPTTTELRHDYHELLCIEKID